MSLFLLSLLGSLPGVIGQYFSTKAQVQLAQIQANTVAIQTDAQMATTQIGMTSNRFKQWMIIALFTPALMTLVSHSAALHIFNNFAVLPQWYLEECVIVFNTVLGINVGIGFVSSMVNHIAAFLTHKTNLAIKLNNTK